MTAARIAAAVAVVLAVAAVVWFTNNPNPGKGIGARTGPSSTASKTPSSGAPSGPAQQPSGPSQQSSGPSQRTSGPLRRPAVLNGHRLGLTSVAFSPDGSTLATGSADNTARLWDVANGTTIHTLTGHDVQVHTVAFSPDGNTLATASLDHTARLWNVAATRRSGCGASPTDRRPGTDEAYGGEALFAGLGAGYVAGGTRRAADRPTRSMATSSFARLADLPGQRPGTQATRAAA